MALNITGLDNISLTNVSVTDVVSNFSISNYISTITPLVIFILGISIYAFFVFKFYRFLARRDILKLKRGKYYEGLEGVIKKFFETILYVLENLVLIPLLVFFWFAILAALILVLTKTQNLDTILLSSMAIVAAVRVTSYYKEDLSRDLAKMIPFALLGIFIIDLSYFSVESSLALAKQIPLFLDKVVFYLLFVVIVEFVLRIIFAIVHKFKKVSGFKNN